MSAVGNTLPFAQALEVGEFEAWALLLGFFIVWVAVGFVLKRLVRTEDDALVAGRRVGNALGTLTILAAWITSGTILGASELSWGFGLLGIVAIMLAGGLSLFFFAAIAPRIQRLMPTGRTVGDFYRLRFDKKNYFLFIPMTLIWDVGFLMSLALGGGIVMETLFGINYQLAVISIMAVCAIYVSLSQMVSVIANDWLQGMIIMTVMVSVMIFIFATTGIGDLYDPVRAKNPDLIDFVTGPGFLLLGAFPLYGTATVFIDNLWWSRVWSITNVRQCFTVAGAAWSTIALISGLTSFIVIREGIIIDHPNEVFPKAMAHFLPTGGAIITLMIVVAVIASSIAALLWAASSILLIDGYKQFINKNPTRTQFRRMSRVAVLLFAAIVTAATLPKPGTVVTLLLVFGIFGSSYLFPITLGLYWARTNRLGAFLGVIAGATTGQVYYWLGANDDSLQANILACSVSGVVVLLFTLLRPETFDWRVMRDVPRDTEVSGLKEGELHGAQVAV